MIEAIRYINTTLECASQDIDSKTSNEARNVRVGLLRNIMSTGGRSSVAARRLLIAFIVCIFHISCIRSKLFSKFSLETPGTCIFPCHPVESNKTSTLLQNTYATAKPLKGSLKENDEMFWVVILLMQVPLIATQHQKLSQWDSKHVHHSKHNGVRFILFPVPLLTLNSHIS